MEKDGRLDLLLSIESKSGPGHKGLGQINEVGKSEEYLSAVVA